MKRLLVVDDHAATADALRALLEMDGYDVVALTSSAEALRRLPLEHFDALITDLEMPEVHGKDLVRAASPMPVVVVTAYSDSPIAAETRSDGPTRILQKPVEYTALLAAVAAVLGAG